MPSFPHSGPHLDVWLRIIDHPYFTKHLNVSLIEDGLLKYSDLRDF